MLLIGAIILFAFGAVALWAAFCYLLRLLGLT